MTSVFSRERIWGKGDGGVIYNDPVSLQWSVYACVCDSPICVYYFVFCK